MMLRFMRGAIRSAMAAERQMNDIKRAFRSVCGRERVLSESDGLVLRKVLSAHYRDQSGTLHHLALSGWHDSAISYLDKNNIPWRSLVGPKPAGY